MTWLVPTRRAHRALAVLLWAGALGACTLLEPDDGDQDDLESARARWNQAGLSSYRVVETVLCFCPTEWRGPVVVTVTGSGVTRVYQGGGAVPPNIAPHFLTVAELFDEIEEALDAGAHQVDVRYDPPTGAPLEVYIDRDERAVDEEIRWQLTPPERI